MNSNLQKIIILIVIGVFAIGSGYEYFTNFLPDKSDLNQPAFNKNSSVNTPKEIFTSKNTHNLNSIASNQWYSSIYNKFPTLPIYALPLVYQISQDGLSFSYPEISKTENTISAAFKSDFTIGTDNKFVKPKLNSIGDFHVNITLPSKNNDEFSFTLAHGVPYTNIKTNTQKAILTFSDAFEIYDKNTSKQTNHAFASDSFVVSIKNKNYIFVLPHSKKISVLNKVITIEEPQSIFVGLLDKRNRYDLFKEISNIQILNTESSSKIQQNNILTTYELTTNNVLPLVALYPHQYENTSEKLDVLGSYNSLRGTLELVRTKSFTTSIPMIRPSDKFSKTSQGKNEVTKQIKADVKETIAKGPPSSLDYFLGTWLGKVDNLILLTDSYDMVEEKKNLINFLEPVFEKSIKNFKYDNVQKSIIASKPEFGNEKLNDHHFHYGYFIRTAAVLSQFNPEGTDKYRADVNEMVLDIANMDKKSDKYPYLRNFDTFEGHSWADGYANFNDGNNQESSSEAINAWYSVYLWGKIIKNTSMEESALSLMNTEIQSAYYYWFDKANNYTVPYTHKIASIVWGGKVDFATFFSKETNMIYGIQLLPITPASTYLGKLPNFTKYEDDYRKSGGDELKPWGELFAIWKSFYSPREVLASKDKIIKNAKFEDNLPKSLFLYMIYLNNK